MYTEPSINDGIATPGSTHTTLDVWTDPSVIEGGPLTTASDVFAFGIILFELFARERPYAHLLKFKAKQTSRVQVRSANPALALQLLCLCSALRSCCFRPPCALRPPPHHLCHTSASVPLLTLELPFRRLCPAPLRLSKTSSAPLRDRTSGRPSPRAFPVGCPTWPRTAGADWHRADMLTYTHACTCTGG